MKKYILGMVLALTSLTAGAGVIAINGSVNLVAGCGSSLSKNGQCVINESGINLTISCSGVFQKTDTNLMYCSGYKTVFSSNAPFILETDGQATVTDDFNVEVNTQYATTKSLKFKFGMTNGLTESLQGATGILYASYNNALNAANLFKGEIAKTHRGHMTRFISALTDGITLMDPKAKEKVTIVDWRVQENARLIVVFGTIMNELLTDYDDVARLKTAINALSSLISQLRVSYGWERGLAGTVSKASSALLQVVRLEIQELASIKMAMGESNLTPYTNILRISGVLLSKVNASKSGDMKAQREMFDFADAWNSKEFQAELGRLLNAGPDFKNIVLPKIVMLLKAIESINDLADMELIIPGAENR
ncbi:MAG: hypothetical protein WC635_01020 [Bacteriovorax sp.]|jgi:hypothetical protein